MSMKTVMVCILAIALLIGMTGMASAASVPVSKIAVHGTYGGVPIDDGVSDEHFGYVYKLMPQSYTAYYGDNATTVNAGDLAAAKAAFTAAGLTVPDNATITNDQDKYCHKINQGGMSDEVTIRGADGKCHVSYGDWVAQAYLNE